MARVPLLLAAVLVSSAATAFAQEAATDAANGPGFVTLDRQDGTSRIGGELSYLSPSTYGYIFSASEGLIYIENASRYDLHGQYVDTSTGFGVYGALPLSVVNKHADVDGNGHYHTLGDLEVGGLFVRGAPNIAFVVHAGITLPSAPSGSGDAVANGIGSAVRLTDLYLAIPHGWSLRTAAALLVRDGPLFLRLEGGFDHNLSSPDTFDVHDVMRLGAGIGADAGGSSFTIESVHLYDVHASTWIDEAAVSVRWFGAEQLQPYVALVLPLDEEARKALKLAVTLGLERSFGPR